MPEIEARFAICVLQNREQKLLLVKRSDNRDFGPALWGFPGGHIEAHESPLDCAWRELHEELGPRNQVHLIKTAGPFYDEHWGGRFEAHLFLYDWLSGTIELDHEHVAYQWVTLDQLDQYTLMPNITDNLMHLDLIKP